jgi:hypothetical protein
MIPEKNFNGDGFDDLRIENELKKIKLMFEHGADFFYPDNQNDLPPELENEFLKNIEEFENACMNSKQIPVYDFIGKPEFRKQDSIPDDEIHDALDSIIELLNDNQIDLSTICKVDDRELYRFITEELFLEDIDDMRIEGMICCFLYEEFHPNHEYDIKDHCAEFITSFLNKESDIYTEFITEEKETIEFLNNFRDAFESFSLIHFLINDVSFNEEHAVVDFKINFSGRIEGTNEKQYFNGRGDMELVYIHEYWCIQKIRFPEAKRNMNIKL